MKTGRRTKQEERERRRKGGEEEAKKSAVLIKEHELDVFVKQWETIEKEVNLTEEEQVWIQSFIKQWEKTLVSVSNQEGIMADVWKQLVTSYPTNSNKFIELVNVIASVEDNALLKTNDLEQQKFLLSIWQQYESFLY